MCIHPPVALRAVRVPLQVLGIRRTGHYALVRGMGAQFLRQLDEKIHRDELAAGVDADKVLDRVLETVRMPRIELAQERAGSA